MSRCLKSNLTNLSLKFYSKSASNRYAERFIPKRVLKASEQTPTFQSEEQIGKINDAVQKYLQNYEKHAEFFENKNKEFELGKRHLANIMGFDPDNITQTQIDKALKYLFPSGLFHVSAHPVMRPPSEIYPKFKTAHFDRKGRPFNSFFYTALENYYETLYELYNNYEDLNRIEDENNAKGVRPTEADKFSLLTHSIIDKSKLEELFVEKLFDSLYNNFVNHLTKLIEHPYSALKNEFISKFTMEKIAQKSNVKQYEVLIDKHGKEYSQAFGKRKNLECNVKIYNNGTGIFLINDFLEMNHFSYFLQREQILTPLVMADLIDKIDIYCYFEPTDKPLRIDDQSRQSGAIRLAISKAICPFVNAETRELLRLNGLLQHDVRTKERKKPGLIKARKRPPFRKR